MLYNMGVYCRYVGFEFCHLITSRSIVKSGHNLTNYPKHPCTVNRRTSVSVRDIYRRQCHVIHRALVCIGVCVCVCYRLALKVCRFSLSRRLSIRPIPSCDELSFAVIAPEPPVIIVCFTFVSFFFFFFEFQNLLTILSVARRRNR